MAIFTAARLLELCPHYPSGTLETIAMSLEESAESVGVNTFLRRAHFTAQVAYESDGFRRFVENLNYSAERIAVIWPRLAPRAHELARKPRELGNAAYANRMGNGDEASGDGFTYAGRGLIQLTGKDNYREAGQALDIDLLSHPERAAEPMDAARIALWFWAKRGCNKPADLDDISGVTRLINGGLHGLAERTALTQRAKAIFAGDELIA